MIHRLPEVNYGADYNLIRSDTWGFVSIMLSGFKY